MIVGIRIHKVVGYGLTDVKMSKFEIKDSRFNPDGICMTDWELKDINYTKKGYVKWLEEKKNSLEEEIKDIIIDENTDKKGRDKYYQIKFDMYDYTAELDYVKKQKHFELYNYFYHQSEFGLPKVLCIRPVREEDWYRHDDIIDWLEHKGIAANKVKIIPQGIYPYDSCYHNIETGESVKSDFVMLFNTYKNKKTSHTPEHINMVLTNISKNAGFESIADFQSKVKVKVPIGIQMLCEYCRVFNDPSTIKTLKPMIYTYWC